MTLFGLKKYSYGPYNKNNETEQWIRITEGCPHHHEYCYEPKEIKVFGIPEIVRNTVKIMDMNLLCKPEALGIIKELGEKRVSGKVVYYELICGVDFRFLTQEIALWLGILGLITKDRYDLLFGCCEKRGILPMDGSRFLWFVIGEYLLKFVVRNSTSSRFGIVRYPTVGLIINSLRI
jgi:hypothetical protein